MNRLSCLALALGWTVASGCVIVSNDDDTAGATDSATDSASASVTESASASATASDSASASASATASDTATTTSTTSDSAGTDTGTGSGMFCIDECQEDSDCEVSGVDAGLTCVGNRCTGEVAGCTDDDFCIAQLSGWTAGTACTMQTDCDAAMQVCLELDDGGHCVTAPSDFIECSTLGFEEFETTNIDGMTVTVCANAGAVCLEDSGTCFVPCATNDDCMSEAYPECNTDTGICGCTADSDCETIGAASASVCLESGVCGCGTDADCADGGGGDVCNDGVCGCSGEAGCEGRDPLFDNTTVVCAGL